LNNSCGKWFYDTGNKY